MKARIIYCDIWEDPEISAVAKHLGVYYWTNHRANLIGLYKTTNAYTTFETGLDEATIEMVKEELGLSKRVHFFEKWIYLPNAQELCGYTNEKTQRKAIEREVAQVPENVIRHFHELGYIIPYRWPTDSLRNNKKETIKNKTELVNQKEEERSRKPESEDTKRRELMNQGLSRYQKEQEKEIDIEDIPF